MKATWQSRLQSSMIGSATIEYSRADAEWAVSLGATFAPLSFQ
jgi:hypothetical protein